MVAAVARVNIEQRRRILEESLKPGGELLGVLARPGSRVRRVSEDPIEAVFLFRSLSKLGRDAPLPTYPGWRVEIPGLGYVGFRFSSKSGEPTMDVSVSIDGLRNVKFKYVGRDS